VIGRSHPVGGVGFSPAETTVDGLLETLVSGADESAIIDNGHVGNPAKTILDHSLATEGITVVGGFPDDIVGIIPTTHPDHVTVGGEADPVEFTGEVAVVGSSTVITGESPPVIGLGLVTILGDPEINSVVGYGD
jgi:hypothetical protein